jgi:hypothetical protein
MAVQSTRSAVRGDKIDAVKPHPWVTGLLLAAGLAPAAPGVHAEEAAITWDPELARPADREAYERSLREVVREAQARVAVELGLPLRRPPAVKVHSRAGFEREFGRDAGHVEAARFVGDVVHVNGGARIDDRFAGVVVHEMTHAALDARGTAASLPRWLDEGLAERSSWRRRGMDDLAPNQIAELRQAGERRVLTPLPAAGPLSPLGYLQSYAAVLFLEGRFGREKVMALVRPTLAGEPFERVLQRELGWSTPDLEREFAAWVNRR